jgi:hypothetical protein
VSTPLKPPLPGVWLCTIKDVRRGSLLPIESLAHVNVFVSTSERVA